MTQALAKAPPEIQRQVFEAFELQIAYHKTEGRVELTATVSKSVADAFEKHENPSGGRAQWWYERDSGARFVSRHHPRIVERVAT